MASPSTGALKVLRDVAIDRMDQNELVAISQVPAVIGEEMSLALITSGVSVDLRVKVLDSRPVVVAGSVRHQLRLLLTSVDAPDADPAGESSDGSTDSASGLA